MLHRGEKVTRPTYTVKGVKQGVEYEFRVTAENKVGAGPPSGNDAVLLLLLSSNVCIQVEFQRLRVVSARKT